jgi:hypothetical protein
MANRKGRVDKKDRKENILLIERKCKERYG